MFKTRKRSYCNYPSWWHSKRTCLKIMFLFFLSFIYLSFKWYNIVQSSICNLQNGLRQCENQDCFPMIWYYILLLCFIVFVLLLYLIFFFLSWICALLCSHFCCWKFFHLKSCKYMEFCLYVFGSMLSLSLSL